MLSIKKYTTGKNQNVGVIKLFEFVIIEVVMVLIGELVKSIKVKIK